MNEGETSRAAHDASNEPHIALLDRIAGVMFEIERVKEERSANELRAVRTQLAELHRVARLRRNADYPKTA